MTDFERTYRVRRRGALLLMLAALATPLAMVAPALADDGGGHDGGGSDGGSGGSDDGGSDDGGSDDGGDNGGSGGSGGSGSGPGSGSSGSASSSNAQQSGSLSDSQAKDGALAQRLKNRIAPVNEIETLAGQIKPGEVLDIKLYKESRTYVYRVKVMQPNGSIYDIKFDAVTRKLLSARQR